LTQILDQPCEFQVQAAHLPPTTQPPRRAGRPRVATTDLGSMQLGGMKLSELQRRAVQVKTAEGLTSSADLEAALDADDPRAALVALLEPLGPRLTGCS
jgi:hypothetical protein